MKRLFFPLLPVLPVFLLGMITALAAGPARPAGRDSVRQGEPPVLVAPAGSGKGRADGARLRAQHERNQLLRQSARDKKERLTALGNRIRNRAEIDTLRGLSREDKAFLRRRHQILHPLD